MRLRRERRSESARLPRRSLLSYGVNEETKNRFNSYHAHQQPSESESAHRRRRISSHDPPLLYDQLKVINFSDAPSLLLPPPCVEGHRLQSTYAAFYHTSWDPEWESRIMRDPAVESNVKKVRLVRRRGRSATGTCGWRWKCNVPLPREVWLRLPHIVWGSAKSLPSSTRLVHSCVSPLQAKLLVVTSRAREAYFFKTFPLMDESPKPSGPPYYLLVNYGANPAFVGQCSVVQGRSCVIREGDAISFLECAWDPCGGVVVAAAEDGTLPPALKESEGINVEEEDGSTSSVELLSHSLPTEERPGCATRLEYCHSVVDALEASLEQLKQEEGWLMVEERDFLAGQLWPWRAALIRADARAVLPLSPRHGTPFPTGLALWCVPPLTAAVLRAVYHGSRYWRETVVSHIPEQDLAEEEENALELRSPIQEQWGVTSQTKQEQGPSNRLCCIVVLPAALPVYLYGRWSDDDLLGGVVTQQSRRLRCGSDAIYYYDETTKDGDTSNSEEPVWTDFAPNTKPTFKRKRRR